MGEAALVALAAPIADVSDLIVFSMFVIFTGAALVATVALYARQSLLVAYVLLGVLVGPGIGRLVSDVALIQDIGHIGIIFLLFLLGLNLDPKDLLRRLRKTVLLSAVSSVVFFAVGALVALAFGLNGRSALLVGVALTFSSTIIGLKLLPTTVLHHQHAGEVMVSVLLFQDMVAITALLLLDGLSHGGSVAGDLLRMAAALPAVVVGAALVARLLVFRLMRRFNRLQEYLFLLVIGWCLGVAQAAHALGLSYEVGAFIAGVALATEPISRFIAESLKPLRDFFLVVFFFTLGAGFDVRVLGTVALPALVLAAVTLAIKPHVFRFLLTRGGEAPALSWEMGVRLGQVSEFSLLLAFVASRAGIVPREVASLLELTTLLTFLASSTWVVSRFPTPIAVSDRLRRD